MRKAVDDRVLFLKLHFIKALWSQVIKNFDTLKLLEGARNSMCSEFYGIS